LRARLLSSETRFQESVSRFAKNLPKLACIVRVIRAGMPAPGSSARIEVRSRMDGRTTSSAMLMDLPEALTSGRVIVRCYRPGDGADLWDAVEESRAHLAPFMPWVDSHRCPDDSEAYARSARARWQLREELPMCVREVGTGRYLGGTGLHQIAWDVPSFEVGYWLRASAEGFGFMTEAVQLVCGLAFEICGANRVHIRCDSSNARSAAIPRRLGFTLEGVLRNASRSPFGELRDTLVFSLVPDEYQVVRASWNVKQRYVAG
jgi:RimJ/RimL family protein N-acetyltransferase